MAGVNNLNINLEIYGQKLLKGDDKMEKELKEKIIEWKEYASELKKKMQNEKDREKRKFLRNKYYKTLKIIEKLEKFSMEGS